MHNVYCFSVLASVNSTFHLDKCVNGTNFLLLPSGSVKPKSVI
jgi:hypothetical protein